MPGGPFFNCYPGPFSNVRCTQQTASISVTAKVKESPVANVVESIIETGGQALGGLFQVGPGYDPEEADFERRMKKKPKKKKGRSL